jgi:phosphatidylserine synthase
MLGFICATLSAVNLFFGITGIYKPDPNQYLIALNFSMAWLVALAAIKDILDH